MAKKNTANKKDTAVEVKEEVTNKILEEKEDVNTPAADETASDVNQEATAEDTSAETESHVNEEDCKCCEESDDDEDCCDGNCTDCIGHVIGEHIMNQRKHEIMAKGKVLTRVHTIRETHKLVIGLSSMKTNRIYSPYCNNKSKQSRSLTKAELDLIVNEVVPGNAEDIRVNADNPSAIEIKYTIFHENPFGTMKKLKKRLKHMSAPSIMSVDLCDGDDNEVEDNN